MTALVERQVCIRRQHSTHTKCQCPLCLTHMQRVNKHARHKYLPPADHEQAWEVLLQMQARGLYSSAIESITGIGHRTLENALSIYRMSGHRQSFGRVISARIIAAKDRTPTSGRISVIPSRRRLEALAVMGWPMTHLAERVSLTPSSLSRVRNGWRTVSVQVHNEIARVYRDLARVPGPSGRIAQDARQQGFIGPAGWVDIDDLSEVGQAE